MSLTSDEKKQEDESEGNAFDEKSRAEESERKSLSIVDETRSSSFTRRLRPKQTFVVNEDSEENRGGDLSENLHQTILESQGKGL